MLWGAGSAEERVVLLDIVAVARRLVTPAGHPPQRGVTRRNTAAVRYAGLRARRHGAGGPS
ncbi:hypothetical protein HRK28_16680 [Rathayibacter sp. VKM Ac-2835]|nr:hypothetical protein [Rathayibacter sp. VKM Ac-2835]